MRPLQMGNWEVLLSIESISEGFAFSGFVICDSSHAKRKNDLVCTLSREILFSITPNSGPLPLGRPPSPKFICTFSFSSQNVSPAANRLFSCAKGRGACTLFWALCRYTISKLVNGREHATAAL